MYESRGLVGARLFINDIEGYFLLPLKGASGVRFGDSSGTTLHYIRGISGENIELQPGSLPSTDTRTITLPRILNVFEKSSDNRVFYKVLATLQWADTASGIFYEIIGTDGTVVDLLCSFSDTSLAKDLFAILQLGRSFHILEQEFPGLVRQGCGLCLQLMEEIQPGGLETDKTSQLKK